MDISISPGNVKGSVQVPGSKSHTIRALLIASLADGKSTIKRPLLSNDTAACKRACRNFGVHITESEAEWQVEGTSGRLKTPDDIVNVGNSGTTLYLAASFAALAPGWSVFTGDDQIRKRSAKNLLQALSDLGATAFSSRDNGNAPLIIRGPLTGGVAKIECPTSQYLSSLLLTAPLAESDTEIHVPLLYEKPYVDLTLSWLNFENITYERENYELFKIPGNQHYPAFSCTIPGDFSSASFLLCAAAVTGSTLKVSGLNREDSQGDKVILDILEQMGCKITSQKNAIIIEGSELKGMEIDCNAIPDALPILAVTACYAKGTTHLVNVPQARLKETDRIAVMAQELTKMGADIHELPEGLVVKESKLHGAEVFGHHDHRVVMALAIAALGAYGKTSIQTAEAADVTFPNFFDILNKIKS